jgi:Tfp pilus assembly protein PilF
MNKASSCASILGLFTACGLLSLLCTPTFPPNSTVKLREETLMIPTYAVGEPEKNPIFYFGRAYQGARGPVYPYPFLDVLTDRRMDRTYKALYLENEYVRFCLLPEIGGRIFEAVDKTNGYNFFYRQHVIKPALIGMLGAWISGGVEWNIPHHHRATSFLPVNWTMTENPDGSKTAWVGEIELRQRTKWAVGLTLRPGSSVLEVDYRIANRTPYAQSILCWANAAVHANENYQVIFPPGTRLATFHGKNQFSHWPISHEVYNGVDYTRGVDVSWWKNHPAPTSFFAFESAEDFFAGYDHGRRAGVVFVGDHGASPGKKLWTWGTGGEGKRWERILTDTDGPYLELMFGSFSDNQPDYSWLQPYEVKTFKQYWYPLREMGSVTQANARAACGVEFRPGSKAVISLNVTSVRRGARLRLTIGQPGPAPGRDAPQLDSGGQFRLGSGSKEAEKVVFEETVDIGPERPYFRVVSWPRDIDPGSLHLYFYSAEGEELISSHPATSAEPPLPQPVTPPLAPQDMKTNEELYLAGLRLEQFHNPSLDPDAYYEEILKRDPDDSRANTALGRLSILRGRREEAERFLRRAVGRLTANYTRPKDGEPLYYLGLAQRAQGKGSEAFETFGRAAWSLAWSAASWLQMAELEAGQGHLKRALELAEQSLALNGKNAQASDLKTALLRRLGRLDEAGMTALAGLAQDPLDLWAANELMLIAAAQGNTQEAHARQASLQDGKTGP